MLLLVFPVRGEALLGDLVHAAATDLDLYPLAVGPHDGEVKRLVAVRFGAAHPVAQTVGADTVDVGDGGVDVPTEVLLVDTLLRLEDDAHGEDVVDVFEGDTLGVHLVPDGEGRLDPGTHFVMQPHGLQLLVDGFSKVLEEAIASALCGGELLVDQLVFAGVFVLETEVL